MTKIIHRCPYTLHGQVLAEQTTTKYLRVTISDNMTWNTSIKQTAAKVNKKLGFLNRNLEINNPDIKNLTYKTVVRPTLEYCNMVWNTHTVKAASQLKFGPMPGCQVGEE